MRNNKREGYSYIWSISDIRTKFVMSESISPYVEINGGYINRNRINKEGGDKEVYEIEVNPYVRYSHIFGDFLHFFTERKISLKAVEIKGKYVELRGKLFHEGIRYLQTMDFITGTTVDDICCEKIMEEMENGTLGDCIALYWKDIKGNDKSYLALAMYNNILTGKSNFTSFTEGISFFFHDSIIYQKKEDKREIIIYINRVKDNRNKGIVKILEELFIPFGIKVVYYWENHFGVVDVLQTLKIGEMLVF